jgi:hypothetical protein
MNRAQTMKNFLLLFLIALLPAVVQAEDTSWDWLVAQYKSGDFEGIDEHAEGRIDGEDYLAMITWQTSPEPSLLLFRKNADRFKLIAKAQTINHAKVSIKNNSLFLEEWTGHHGWHGVRYQFKRIDGEFTMIGAEHRSSYFISCDAGDDSPTCYKHGAFEGKSYNFLTSEALCWGENIRFDDEKRWKEASRRFDAWLQPKGGSRHKMSFRKIGLILLDGSDFDVSDLPETCYFDHQGKLHKSSNAHKQ